MHHGTVLLAAAGKDFWGTPIGGWTQNILAAVGIIIVLLALLKAAGSFLGGKIAPGVKILIMGLIVAAFCFDPATLFNTLISAVSHMLDLFGTSAKFIGGGNSAGTPAQ